MTSAARRLVADVLASERGTSIRVLLYHSVSDDAADPFAVPRDLFRCHMEVLRATGVPTLSCRALLAALSGEAPLTRGVCITVDDGLEDFATTALPVLRACGMPSALFVSTALAGTSATWPAWSGPRCFLDWSELRDLAAEGVEIGSHARTHVRLDVLGEAELVQEVARSRRELAERIPTCLDAIAYPFGGHSAAVRQTAQTAGYRAGFAVGGLWGNRRGIDPFALRRTLITRATTAERVVAIATGRDDRRTAAQGLVRRVRPGGEKLSNEQGGPFCRVVFWPVR